MSDYETGYKKPPHPTKFKPGQSGNPKGRPKGAKSKRMVPTASSLQSMIVSEANREIKINEGGEAISMPVVRAVVRSAGIAAAKGKVPAQKLFLEWTAQAEKERMQSYNEIAEILLEYKDYWKNELDRLAEAGEELPDLPLDPDYIYIVPQTGVVRILDPENSVRDEFILLLDDCRDYRKFLQKRIFALSDEMDETDDPELIEKLRHSQDQSRSYLAKTDAVIAKIKELLG